MAGLAEKSHPPGSYQPPAHKRFPPATKSASSCASAARPKLSREYISAREREPAYVSAAPFQFPRGSRPPLHEGKYLPETDTTRGKQYAPGGIQ